MSLEKIAKILHVDEVKLMHGAKGVAVHVRIEKSWRISTIDNEDLEGRRREAIAECLVHLADGHASRVREALVKGGATAATRAALEADRAAAQRRQLGWDDGTPWVPYDIPIQQQIRRLSPQPAPYQPPSDPLPESPSMEPMPSRFHAVMAELEGL